MSPEGNRKEVGNGVAVRIPASVMQAKHLDLDPVVDAWEEAGRIVIEPVRRKTYNLAELLGGSLRQIATRRSISDLRLAKRSGTPRHHLPYAGDVVWLNFTPQASHEQAGHRPALVLSLAGYNDKTSLMICCPMTTQIKN